MFPKTILLCDITKDVVYVWPIFNEVSKPLLVFAFIKAQVSKWHNRIGHPLAQVLNHLVSS